MSRSKFSKDFKLKIVRKCIEEKASYYSLAREYGVADTTIAKWHRTYLLYGESCLEHSEKNNRYTYEFKKEVVEFYLKDYAKTETISKYNIAASVLDRWVLSYNEGTLEERISMPEVYTMKGRRTTFEERKEIVHYCLAHDKNYKETAKIYSLPYSRVYAMVKGYIKEGEVALMNAKERVNARPLTEIEKLQQENERLKEELKFEKLKFDLVQKKIAIENELSREYKKKHHIKR